MREQPARAEGEDPRVVEKPQRSTLQEMASHTQLDTQILNRDTIVGKLSAEDFMALNDIIAQTNADIRADPSQEIKILARINRRLIRIILHMLDGTE